MGIARLLFKFWNNREKVEQATKLDLFPPPRCFVCRGAWRYGSDEPGAEWVECAEGHRLTKVDFDRPKGPMLNDGDHRGSGDQGI